MSQSIKHDDHVKAVYVYQLDDNGKETECDDIYLYQTLDNVDLFIPDWKEIPNLYNAVQYYRDAVINRLSKRESFND